MESNSQSTTRVSIIENWVREISLVLGGKNLFIVSQYYQTGEGRYKMFGNSVSYWYGNGLQSVVSISLYRNAPWNSVNQTTVYVF